MNWRDEAARGLPAPRDDEPASLRQDILDELADHFYCALGRELAKNLPPDEAVKNVRRRFGDPRAIARTLWFDARKEQIMSQRLTIAMMVLVACTSIVSAGFAWMAIRESRTANSALLQQIAETNAKSLAQLTQLAAKVPSAGTASDLRPVKCHLVLGKKGGPPAVGFAVHLESPQNSPFPSQSEKSDQNGNVDFGVVPYGAYALTVTHPQRNGQSPFLYETTWKTITVRPQSSISEEIVCPPAPLRPVDCRLQFDWPADLSPTSNFWIVCQVHQSGREFDGWQWRGGFENVVLTLTPGGEILFSGGRFTQYLRSEGAPVIDRVRFDPGIRTPHPFPSASGFDSALGSFREWTEQRYQITDLAIVRARDGHWPPGDAADRQRAGTEFPVLGWCTYSESRFTPFSADVNFPPDLPRTRPRLGSHSGKLEFMVKSSPPAFEPVYGKKNLIRIALPDTLLDQVRDVYEQAKKYNLQTPGRSKQADDVAADAKIGTHFLMSIGLAWQSYPPTQQGQNRLAVGATSGLFLSGGVIVVRIADDAKSPAVRAGLKSSDILIALDGWTVADAADVGSVVRHAKGKKSLTFLALRGEGAGSHLVSGQLDVPPSVQEAK